MAGVPNIDPVTGKVISEDGYVSIVETVNPSLTFIGKTKVPTGASQDILALKAKDVWQIQRVLTQGTHVTKEYAVTGDAAYEYVWDDRFSLFAAPPAFPNSFSLLMDGIDSRLDVADAPEIQFDTNDAFTISYWAKSTNAGILVHFEKAVGNLGYIVLHIGTGLLVSFGTLLAPDSVRFASTGAQAELTDGDWHHYVWTHSGSGTFAGMTFYIDGTAIGITSQADALVTNPNAGGTLSIGSRTNATFNYDGNMDEFSMWPVELDAANVAALYNSGKPVDLKTDFSGYNNAGNLAFWLRMGDGDVYPTIQDNQGSNDGTMINMITTDIVVDTP